MIENRAGAVSPAVRGLKMQVGTKFKGQINGEVFEIIKEISKNDKLYFK